MVSVVSVAQVMFSLIRCAVGSMLESGLNNGASRVIGIDKVGKYLKTCRRRIGQ